MIDTIFKVATGVRLWIKAPSLVSNWIQNLPLGQRARALEIFHKAIGNRISPLDAKKGALRLTGKITFDTLAKERRPRFKEIPFL